MTDYYKEEKLRSKDSNPKEDLDTKSKESREESTDRYNEIPKRY